MPMNSLNRKGYSMVKQLAFVLINPYTIRKSRTGGVIARYLVRTDLKLAAARMFGASQELVDEMAAYLVDAHPEGSETGNLLADYVRRAYAPDPHTVRTHRCICLLFEGEDAIRKIYSVTGDIRQCWGSGQSLRDTYGDFVCNELTGNVVYFEPAVIVGPIEDNCRDILRIWLKHTRNSSCIVRGAADLLDCEGVEQTLVLLKPDNFRQPSLRAGNIMDLLSSSGLRIVALKKLAMSVAQATAFYNPVCETLAKIFPTIARDRAAQALSREFGLPVDAAMLEPLCVQLAPLYARREFENIVEFMTGRRPANCSDAEKLASGLEECLAIVYEGLDAVKKIRDILGPTDPSKARPGSIRREFGTNIMVNAAHASDSVENASREMSIINMTNDIMFEELIQKYYP